MKGAGSETKKTWVIRGRRITSSDIAAARGVVEEFFGEGRNRIASELAQYWQWRSSSGRLKDRACLAILVALEGRGYLRLPPPIRARGPARDQSELRLATAPGEELSGQAGDYRPFCWQLVSSEQQRRQWRKLMATYHYLGAPNLVGANLKYFVYSDSGDLLGALAWQSAVERLDCRDRLVGLTGRSPAREEFLAHAVNNVRFLIPPWVRIKCLASALLAEGLKALQKDWPRYYGQPVWLAESFLDRSRFSGASYRAANWVALGWTRGYAKEGGQFIYHGQPKEIYIYVIEKRIRRILMNDPAQELLRREFLLAQRPTGNPKAQARRRPMTEVLQSWTPEPPPDWELTAEDLQEMGRDLNDFGAEFGPAFRRIEPRELCQLYLQGLLSGTERKNVEAMAMELKGPGAVRKLQRFIGQYEWDESWMKKRHWKLSAESLAEEAAAFSVDASETPKKGQESVGVARQYCGSSGKIDNCQSGVYIGYSSSKGHTLLDCRLYLPEHWLTEEYKERREACHVPEEITFKTKPQIAADLLSELWESGLFPGRWITCDSSFGNDEAFLAQLPEEMLYLAEIPRSRKVWLKHAPEHRHLETDGCTVEDLLEQKGLLHWESRKVNDGQKGPIVAGFARVRVYLSSRRTAQSERTLLLRNDPDGKIKYALSNAPEETPMRELVRVSALRWPIERCFQEGKSHLGLDHYEHRSWPAWHRHMRLVFLAHLFLQRERLKFKKKAPALTLPQARALLEWCLPRPKNERDYIISFIRYHQLRNHCAKQAHRRRRLKELSQWKDIEIALSC